MDTQSWKVIVGTMIHARTPDALKDFDRRRGWSEDGRWPLGGQANRVRWVKAELGSGFLRRFCLGAGNLAV